jgi:hypothetical protein
MFSLIDVKSVSGSHLIYKNRNSKVDIDIDKILIENYADPKIYRMVLCQGGGSKTSGFGLNNTSTGGDSSGASGDVSKPGPATSKWSSRRHPGGSTTSSRCSSSQQASS